MALWLASDVITNVSVEASSDQVSGEQETLTSSGYINNHKQLELSHLMVSPTETQPRHNEGRSDRLDSTVIAWISVKMQNL